MIFQLTILGCNSAVPTKDRFTTSQLLQVSNHAYLIDAGEGMQLRLSQFTRQSSKINQVFISHLHGDHILGLMGWLTSLSMRGRKKPMDIFSPEGLQQMIEVQSKWMAAHMTYPLNFHIVDTTVNKQIFEDDKVTVHTIPLIHRVPASGYLFKEKPHRRRMRVEKIEEYNIPRTEIKAIKKQKEYTTEQGKIIPVEELLLPPTKQRSFAFCSDTIYTESIIPIIKGVDLLYHETTFLHEALDRAIATKHTTALQAGMIAKAAEVGKLITGHYSSRYGDLSVIVREAQTHFPNTIAGEDGKVYEVELDKSDS
ncbi:MAG: ribonuclease Z [Saprospiraceae bacterium]